MVVERKTTLKILISGDKTQTEELVQKLKNQDFKLNKDRNFLRKSFLKITKKTVRLKIEIDKKLKIKEAKEMARQAKIDDISIPVFDGINFTS